MFPQIPGEIAPNGSKRIGSGNRNPLPAIIAADIWQISLPLVEDFGIVQKCLHGSKS